MMKRTLTILLCAVLLAGCTGFETDELLTPPMLSDEQEAVLSALKKTAGEDMTLVYPRGGDERSAFVFADLDGDGGEEAAAFYISERDSVPNVHMCILDTNENGWYSSFDHTTPGTALETVFFTGFSSDTTYIAAGYSLTTSEDRTLCIYHYADGTLTTDYSGIYSLMQRVDINIDGGEDIVLLNKNTESHPAYAALITDTGKGVERTSTVNMRTGTTDLVRAISGGVAGGAAAVFADSSTGSGNITTEVIYCVGGELRDPAAAADSEIPALTVRRNLYCCDIDGDGIIEIPTTEPFPGYRESDNTFITYWNEFENYSLTRKYSSYYDSRNGYCFMMPVRWEGLVTVKTEPSTGERVFYKFNSSLSESRLELMRIASVSPEEADTYEAEGYMNMLSAEGRAIMVRSRGTDNLVLTRAEIEYGMYAISS